MLEETANRFKSLAPKADYWSLRVSDEWRESVSVRQDKQEPIRHRRSTGAMITIRDGRGTGYAATSDFSQSGLRGAAHAARDWARKSATLRNSLRNSEPITALSGGYRTAVEQPWASQPLRDKIDWLIQLNRRLRSAESGGPNGARNRGDRIVDWFAYLAHADKHTLFTSSDGAHIDQNFQYIDPGLSVVANEGSHTQRRTYGGGNLVRQGGLERVAELGLEQAAERLSHEVLALLDAPPCPSGEMDILIMPGQMMLQIHESVGHPLELDRILGDERNYAGTSFVTLDMFGRYRYGSELLNITFDPTRGEELATYAYDDEGSPAHHEYLIRDGILLRPLGGATSQQRAAMPGVANARAADWNRPPIDRMANLNMPPGNSSMDELIGAIEQGVLVDTNSSWSIDDSRNKFQFGCEYGQVIEDKRLGGLVRNPNYRGVSETFWRSLDRVGDELTFAVYGTPYCGKGEPNQVIQVGHGSPACVFRNVSVFGSQ